MDASCMAAITGDPSLLGNDDGAMSSTGSGSSTPVPAQYQPVRIVWIGPNPPSALAPPTPSSVSSSSSSSSSSEMFITRPTRRIRVIQGAVPRDATVESALRTLVDSQTELLAEKSLVIYGEKVSPPPSVPSSSSTEGSDATTSQDALSSLWSSTIAEASEVLQYPDGFMYFALV